MRIALLIQRPQARGQELFASALGNYLLGQGHEVILISLFSGDFPLDFQGKLISLEWIKGGIDLKLTRMAQLSQALKSFGPDIIQANGGDTLKYGILTRMIFPFPGKFIFNNGGVVSYYFQSKLQNWVYRYLLNKVDGIISISKYSAVDIKSLMNKSIPQTQIPIGLDLNQKLNLADPVPYPVFIHIGGFTPEKNHSFLLKLWEEFEGIYPQAQLILIGDGPLKEQISETARSSIHFLGSSTHPWGLIPKNAILLLPSKIEGMPAVLAESALAGIPAISHCVGGIPEMLAEIPASSQVDFENISEWIQAMKYWMELSPKEKNRLLTISKERVREKFALEAMGERFLEFYQTL